MACCELLEHQDAGALADDEAVAVLVEGPAGGAGVVVAAAERAQRVEPGDAEVGDRRFAAARDHRVALAVADVVEGGADAVRAGGARGGDRVVRALGPVDDRDVASRAVDDHLRHQERADS